MLTKDLLLHILMDLHGCFEPIFSTRLFLIFFCSRLGSHNWKKISMNNFFLISFFFLFIFFSNAVFRLKCFFFTHFLLLYWILLSSSFAFQILSIWFSHETFCACPFSLDLNAYTHAYHHQKSGWVAFYLAGDRSLS